MDVVGSGEKQGSKSAEPARGRASENPGAGACLLGWLHEPQDGMRPGVIPWNTCQIPSEFPYGEGVFSLLRLFSLYFHLSWLLCLSPFLCPEQFGSPCLLLLLAVAAKPHGWLTTCTFPAPDELLSHMLIWGFLASKYSLASKPFSRLYPEGTCALTYQQAWEEVGARRAVGRDLAPCHISGRLFCLWLLEEVLL